MRLLVLYSGLLIALTGAGIGITIITLSVRTIVRSCRERKQYGE